MRLYLTDSRPSHLGALGHSLDPATLQSVQFAINNGLSDAEVASSRGITEGVAAEVRAEMRGGGGGTDYGKIAAGIFQQAAPVGVALAQQQGWLPRGQTAMAGGSSQAKSAIPWTPIIIGVVALGGLYFATR